MTACFAFSTPVHAAQSVPYKINFQGRLTNISGTTLTGTYDMQFRLFTASTGGSAVWAESRTAANTNAVTVTNGLFNVLLGDGTPITSTLQAVIPANMTLYLEVQVGTETLTPRSQFGSSAYAINADMIDGIDGASLAQLSGANSWTAAQNITTASANAFQVKNGSTSLFNVDTSSSAVTIGASDTTAAVLVLDTKTNSGDPTVVAGGMYYNSNSGKLRCSQGGVWVDCVTTVSTTLQDAYNNDASGVADITTTSAAKTFLFKAGATFDSATLFDIQDASGVNLFTVDSVNDRVYIGDSGADAVGTVLVLDTKNTAGDPTGVDGAMYYNSASKSFECYKNGLWNDCNFASLRSEWMLQEDFIDSGVATATIGLYEWTLTDTGSATEAKVNASTDASNRDRFGIYQTTTAATTGSGNMLRLDNNAMAGTPSNMTVEFDFGPSNTAAADGTQTIVRIGLHNGTTTSTAPTDGIYFQYSTTTAAGNWFRCTRNNSAETCADTGVARTLTVNVYQRFKFVTNSTGTSVEFFINEASVGSNTTNLPANTRPIGPAIGMHTANATARAWKIDYYQIKRNLTTLR